MNKRFISTTFILSFAMTLVLGSAFDPSTVQAKKAQAPAGPTAQQQQAFTERFYNAADGTGREYGEFVSDVMNNGTQEEINMLSNLQDGKAADGGEPKGFRGDPDDPGPTDWSDWNIQTDANGNVTGFTEKDFEEKDADGDGEISDEEREEWNKKKEKENEEAGGPPGDNYHPPDWDKDEDGKPDPGFTLDCWQCRKPVPEEDKDECAIGSPSCREAPGACEKMGFSSDPACSGQCPPMACIPLDVDKKSGNALLPNQTRERGSTERCYRCMKITRVEVTYIVIVIETPYYRIVLDRAGTSASSFVPSSVMVLADKEKLQEKLQNLSMISHGGFNPDSILQNALGMEQVSGMLKDTLARGGKFTDDCFGAFQSFMPSLPSMIPPSFSGGGKASRAASALPSGGMPSVPGMDVLSELRSMGPVVACGMSGAEKVLSLFDADGRLAETISKSSLKDAPDAVAGALQKAQDWSDRVLNAPSRARDYLWKKAFSSLPAQSGVGSADYPNDPYFNKSPQAKKKKRKKIKVSFGGMDLSPAATMRDLEDRRNSQKELPTDQWGLKEVGYLPKSDPDSAWNVIDGQARNVIVAVIDSGFDVTHPDGPQYVWTNTGEIPDNGIDDDGNGYVDDVHGWNFLDDNNILKDGRGHGTFVAGIIAAKTNNGIGIAGINPGAVIMPLKVADDEGATNSLNMFRAVQYAVSNGASVINISMGGRIPSDLEQMALNEARAHDVFVAVAAGNDNEDIMRHGPASAAGAFSVGAVDRIGTRSTVSNWGANSGLVAPGEQIYSLLSADKTESVLKSVKKAGVYAMSGTSFSTPIAAGTASLMRALHPDYTRDQIEDILQLTADDMEDSGWDSETGAGLLDAAAALQYEWTGQEVTAKVTRIRKNYDSRKRLDSVDVFVTVRGDVKQYTVELGKGKHARRFKPVSVAYTNPADYGFAARIDGKEFNGEDQWIVRVNAVSSSDESVTAQALVDLNSK